VPVVDTGEEAYERGGGEDKSRDGECDERVFLSV
jgi:hypothetical protein